VKSSCQSSPGYVPCLWVPETGRAEFGGLLHWQISYPLIISLSFIPSNNWPASKRVLWIPKW
jgi:hypothetical protein